MTGPRVTPHIGVVGTRHGAGATLVSAALIAAIRAAGARVGALRLAAVSGAPDVQRLRGAGAIARVAIELNEPTAPLVALRRAREAAEAAMYDRALAEVSRDIEAVVVDAGAGLATPIAEGLDTLSLLAGWRAELVIVAHNDEHALNDVLLAARAATAHSMHLAAIVLNAGPTASRALAERTNQAVLKELLRNVPVLSIPVVERPDDPATLARLVRDLPTRTVLSRPA